MAGIGDYDKKSKGSRGFKMKGFSPFTKHQDQVPLSKHEEKKGTMITGSNKNEEVNDLEDRLEFLQSDLDGGGKEPLKVMEKGKILSQMKKLKAQLAKLRGKNK